MNRKSVVSWRPGVLAVSFFVLIFAMPVFAQDGDWPRVIVDGLGTESRLDAPPQHIVSVNLGADEVLLSLVGPERLAAVTALSLDPGISNVAVQSQAVENTIVSSGDIEFIIGLQPDIVLLATFTEPEVLQQLRDAGLTVFTTGFPVGLQAIRDNITLLGQVVGEEARAADLVEQMDSDFAAVSDAVAQDTVVRALYLTPGYYTSGVDSTISEVITAANGVDVAAEAGADQSAPLTEEFIIEQDPDVILLSGWTPWDATFVGSFIENPAFANLSAMTNGRVYVANDAHLTTVSQYIAEGVKDVAAYFWPEAYPVFPVTVTDAAGNEITIDQQPEEAVIISNTNSPLLDELLPYLGDDAAQITSSDALIPDPQTVFFSTSGGIDVPGLVVLYDGDTPAEVVANLTLAGDVLGERVAALNAIAAYTDNLEAQAAQ
jgi:iron complex transport system substrate-binding protein